MSGFTSPVLIYSILAPIIIVLAGAIIGVLLEAFAPRTKRAAAQLSVTIITLVLSLLSVISIRGKESVEAAGGSVAFDGAA